MFVGGILCMLLPVVIFYIYQGLVSKANLAHISLRSEVSL